MSNYAVVKARRNGGNKQARFRGRGVLPRSDGAGIPMHLTHPPQIQDYSIRHGVVLRFTLNAAMANSAITFQNLLDTILFASSAVVGYDVFATVKIRKVEVWSMAILGATSTIDVLFAGATAGQIGDQRLHTDSSMGVEPAHVSARPSPKALGSNYQISTAGTAFTITAPVGSVVDLHLSFCNTFAVPQAAQNALVGATVGATLLRGFDGLAAATSKSTPIYLVAWI